ncbi:MAG TPA: adenylyl-sulfate kinase [Paenibacillaceae bacterium]|nr:adenylyl-sulfate kinase [Paenibacillaceae bacterium]
MKSSLNLVWHPTTVEKKDRQRLNNHRSFILWFTGLSGSGKSTLANAVEKRLFEKGIRTYLLDGDNIRQGVNQGLGFTAEDRKENIRRTGEVAKLFVDAGVIVLTALISPYQEDRQMVRELVSEDEFVEVYVKCPVDECEKRDPKGLYRKAREGVIPNFTGISAPYEEPENPEIIVETNKLDFEESVDRIVSYVLKKALG